MNALENKEDSRALFPFSICLFLAYLLPYHVAPFRAFYNEWLAVFGVFTLLAYLIKKKTVFFQIPWVMIVPFGLIIIIAIQTFAGMLNESWDAFLPIAYLLVTILAIVLGANIALSKVGFSNLLSVLSGVYLMTGLMSVMIASLQLAGAEISFAPFVMLLPRGHFFRPYANLGQANQLAELLCLAIASTWWLFQAQRVRAGMAMMAVLALLWGLALTLSRIGWIIIPLFVLINWVWRGKHGFRIIPNRVALGALFAYGVFVLFALPALSSLLEADATSAIAHVTTGSSIRRILFQQALQMSLSHPWFGVGWFQFGPQQLALAPIFPPAQYSQYAHNILLNFIAEIGWPATAAIIVALAYWFNKIYRKRPLSKEVGAALLLLLPVLVHSFTEYPLWYAYFLLPAGLLVGAIHQEQLGALSVRVPQPPLIIAVIVMASILVGVAMDYRRVVTAFWQMDMKSTGFKLAGFNLDSHATEKPTVTVFPYAYDFFTFMDASAYEGMPASEIASMEKTSKRFPGPLVLTRMSQVYAMNHRDDDAVRAMLDVQHLYDASHYKIAYETWLQAPEKYQPIFKRLPSPEKEVQ